MLMIFGDTLHDKDQYKKKSGTFKFFHLRLQPIFTITKVMRVLLHVCKFDHGYFVSIDFKHDYCNLNITNNSKQVNLYIFGVSF